MNSNLKTTVAAIALLATAAVPSVAFGQVDSAAHDKCLGAADYAGCVKAQTNGVVDEGKEECDSNNVCVAKPGVDRMGLPKQAGYLYKDEGSRIVYYSATPYAVIHKGDANRYVARKVFNHYFDPGSTGTPGRMQSFGGGQTTCNTYGAYGRGVTTCHASPPVQTYIPGSVGRPAGARISSDVLVYDCKEGTGATYADGKKVKNWSKQVINPGSFFDKACNSTGSLEVLSMSL